MNVVPPVTADRAEAVLHDLAMSRARGPAGKGDRAVAVASADVPPPRGRRTGQRPRRASGERAARQGRRQGRGGQVRRGRAAPRPASPARPSPTTPRRSTSPTPANAPAGRGPARPGAECHPQADAPAPAPARDHPRRPTARRGQDALQGRQLPRRPAARRPGQGQSVRRRDPGRRPDVPDRPGRAGWRPRHVRVGARRRPQGQGHPRPGAADGSRGGRRGQIDDGLRQKVQDLLARLPADDAAGKASVTDRLAPADDAEHPRRPEAQRRGRHQDRRGAPVPGDRSRQGDRHLRADAQGRQGVGPPRGAHADDGPPP